MAVASGGYCIWFEFQKGGIAPDRQPGNFPARLIRRSLEKFTGETGTPIIKKIYMSEREGVWNLLGRCFLQAAGDGLPTHSNPHPHGGAFVAFRLE